MRLNTGSCSSAGLGASVLKFAMQKWLVGQTPCMRQFLAGTQSGIGQYALDKLIPSLPIESIFEVCSRECPLIPRQSKRCWSECINSILGASCLSIVTDRMYLSGWYKHVSQLYFLQGEF